jgi:hypothetical protein
MTHPLRKQVFGERPLEPLGNRAPVVWVSPSERRMRVARKLLAALGVAVFCTLAARWLAGLYL